jgi:hypothetical protein
MRFSEALKIKAQEGGGGDGGSGPSGTGITVSTPCQNNPPVAPQSGYFNTKKKKKKRKSAISEFNFNKCLAALVKAQVWNAENLLKGIVGEAAIAVAYAARSNPNILQDESYLNNALYTSMENWIVPNLAENELDIDDTANMLAKQPELINKIKEAINGNIDHSRNIMVLKITLTYQMLLQTVRLKLWLLRWNQYLLDGNKGTAT